jgi:hypothetical protein
MNREDRFIKYYNAVHTSVAGYFSSPEEDRFGKDGHGEDYNLAFSLDPSGQVNVRGYIPSRHAAVDYSGCAGVVVCAGSPAYFAMRIDPKTVGGQNPNRLTYHWEEDLHLNLARLLQFLEDEPTSEVRWPRNANYWRQRAENGTAFAKGRSWLRKMAAVTGKVPSTVYFAEEMRRATAISFQTGNLRF